MLKHEVLQQLTQSKLVAVIRGETAEEAIILSEAAIEGGIQAIELTYTTPFVEEAFKALKNSEALIGAGTVLDAETARHAILLGAQFIVSPSYTASIATLCNRYNVPYLPGCMTLKEMVAATEGGCDILKLFPASQFEPAFIKSVKGPLPNVRIMPTGGINEQNVQQWLNAGAVAAGIGSDLNKAYKAEGYVGAVAKARQYIEAIAVH